MNRKPVILAIDDTPVNLKTLIAALAEDYDLEVATSGTKGLALAQATLPDLILLDIMMPELDGYDVCRRLKEDEKTKNIPVIFISALAEAEAEVSGLELGAVDYLTKPINIPIATKRIQNHLERERLRKRIKRHRDELELQVRDRTLSLSIAKEAAESADKLKATILTNLSHEFRTPMNGILGMLGMARRRTQDSKVQEYLVMAEQAANRLLAMLTGLLDLALAESHQLTLEKTQFRIEDIVSGTINQAQAAVKGKPHLVLQRNPAKSRSIPDCVTGDPGRIKEILHELISNAIKFSEKGSIEVAATVEKDNAGNLWLSFEVSDEGIGIAPENHTKIFEPFHQIDGSQTRRYSGNGVGLALCRQLARHMGGHIAVKSTLGNGAIFTVSIPVETRLPNASPEKPAHVASALLQSRHLGANILVAEDDRAIRILIKAVLEEVGLTVFMAEDGAEAIEMVKSAKFNLILMDLMMPKVSGLDAARTIRALPHYERTPILAVTARAFEHDREECLAVGINAHIPKPFAQELLLSSVLEWLDYGQTHDVL